MWITAFLKVQGKCGRETRKSGYDVELSARSGGCLSRIAREVATCSNKLWWWRQVELPVTDLIDDDVLFEKSIYRA